jgi:hypothetical protein
VALCDSLETFEHDVVDLAAVIPIPRCVLMGMLRLRSGRAGMARRRRGAVHEGNIEGADPLLDPISTLILGEGCTLDSRFTAWIPS